MRLLLVSHRFPPDDVGGVERYTQGLAAEMTRGGDIVTVVARRSERGRKDLGLLRERLEDGTVVYRLLAGAVSFEHFLENHRFLEQCFVTALIESSPDIVHINHVMGLSPRFIQIAHQLGAAVVVSLHDFYFACPKVHLQKPGGELCSGPDGGQECVRTCFTSQADFEVRRWDLRSRYFRRALTMAEQTICYSDYVGTYFGALLGSTSNLSTVPNGVPTQFDRSGNWEPGRARQGSLSVAYCGTVAPHKGPHVLLDALRRARVGTVDLRIIGHFPEVEYASRLRAEAEVIPGLTLRMYGAYERRELPHLLEDVDCVVVPSLVPEAGPIVPREALALGVPLVVARLGALREIVREGVNGLTFAPDRPEELAAILRRLADSDELLAHLRAGAHASPVITLEYHARMVRSIYEKALKNFNGCSRGEPGNTEEFTSLHQALVQLGCDTQSARHSPVESIHQ